MQWYLLFTLCGLLGGASGAATSVDVQLSSGGITVQGDKVDAKLNDEIAIRCVYDDVPVLQVPAMYHQANESVEIKQMFVFGGELHQPWQSRKDDYEITEGDESLFFIEFKIKAITMIDRGKYICTMNKNNAIQFQKEASVSVAANVQLVEIDGVVDGKYKVDDAERRQQVVCRAYNGSRPQMTLRIAGVDDPIEHEHSSYPRQNEYEFTFYYNFDASMNGKQIICEAEVPGYAADKVIAVAMLQILAKPAVTCPGEVKPLADKATIECTISGTPLPAKSDIKWIVLKNGHTMDAEDESKNLGLTSSIKLEDDVYKAKLEIFISDLSYGRYTLSVSNAAGPKTAQIIVSKTEKVVVRDGASMIAVYGGLHLLTLAVCLLR